VEWPEDEGLHGECGLFRFDLVRNGLLIGLLIGLKNRFLVRVLGFGEVMSMTYGGQLKSWCSKVVVLAAGRRHVRFYNQDRPTRKRYCSIPYDPSIRNFSKHHASRRETA
jgi:hypothetical protein